MVAPVSDGTLPPAGTAHRPHDSTVVSGLQAARPRNCRVCQRPGHASASRLLTTSPRVRSTVQLGRFLLPPRSLNHIPALCRALRVREHLELITRPERNRPARVPGAHRRTESTTLRHPRPISPRLPHFQLPRTRHRHRTIDPTAIEVRYSPTNWLPEPDSGRKYSTVRRESWSGCVCVGPNWGGDASPGNAGVRVFGRYGVVTRASDPAGWGIPIHEPCHVEAGRTGRPRRRESEE